jgi:hypothetical protein
MTPSERDIEAFFPRIGLRAVRIPERQTRTPDYRVEGDRLPILLEGKSRQDPDQLRQTPIGQIYEHKENLDDNAGAHNLIRDAVEQFDAFDPNHEQLHIVWLSPESWLRGDDGGAEFIVRALHGVRDVIDITDGGIADPVKCFYALEGSFERFPSVDAAIMILDRVPALMLSDFGRRRGELRSTRLVEEFEQAGGLNTVAEFCTRGGGIMIAGGNAGRSEAEILRILRQEHGLHRPTFLQPKAFAAAFSVPRR